MYVTNSHVAVVDWLLNVTFNDISVIYVTTLRCAGRLKKKFDLRSGSQPHRQFVGFFYLPVQAPTRDHPFYSYSEKQPHFIRLLRCGLGYGGPFLLLNLQGLNRGWLTHRWMHRLTWLNWQNHISFTMWWSTLQQCKVVQRDSYLA